MRRLLRGCEVVAFDETAAHAAGSLLGKTRTKDVVDASVAVLSIRHGADVVSDDAEDIQQLLSAARAKGSVLDV
jgi:predicted nucleic acid-binding protein